MKKRYSQFGSEAGSIHGAIQVSKNTFAYRGFTIRKTPRNIFNERQTYLINKRDEQGGIDNYYGRDFALVEACNTVDRMLNDDRFTAA
ncbi:hypothetical protein NUKP32_31860 [Klebsiella variicola]|uniref:DUF4761 family protein n=1 Tax=Klebsiella TaxID=570 RepID=UPI0021816A99|nr:DUF4761 family protein [Klebsiella variicola]HCM7227013.1 DUF4761 family protein [Klebsiella aerogenes]GKJ53249.1 hypothetical protein NUKP32_31860 [Klebsiella variicola]HDU5937093.1 DUF4761 family protein [Klebsiella variicola]HEC0400363.1 DUF4761 family protein [Klebsiella aerogenes]HEC1355702.1 DUF4761 family protein [Klebsiella aerogenes]